MARQKSILDNRLKRRKKREERTKGDGARATKGIYSQIQKRRDGRKCGVDEDASPPFPKAMMLPIMSVVGGVASVASASVWQVATINCPQLRTSTFGCWAWGILRRFVEDFHQHIQGVPQLVSQLCLLISLSHVDGF